MIPFYLLADSSFWIFTVLYLALVFGTVAIVIAVMRRFAVPPAVRHAVPLFVPILFTLLIIEQLFHQAEHITQMYQFQVLGLPAKESHGFVWFLDDEWNHFVFNTIYMTGITVVFLSLLRALKDSGIKKTFANAGFIIAFLVMEGWHIVEHTYRIIHHAQGLCNQCAGILDPLTGIDRLVLHFWLNFMALTLPMIVFFWYETPSLLKALHLKRAARLMTRAA